MQVHFGVELLRAEWPGAVVCIGTFDGVHLGHQEVVRAAVSRAAELEQPCVVVTFDRHPAAILNPSKLPKAIASLEENLVIFEKVGAAVTVVLPFDKALSETHAEDFFTTVLRGRLLADSVVVGHDFAFGKGREGTPEWLQTRIETVVVPPFEMDGKRVSSSEIRRAIEGGRIEDATRWLGRPFELPGVVVAGQRLGRQLGYPTLNLARSFDQVLPSDGIYAGNCLTRLGEFKAAISIGYRPAVQGTTRTIEAYLLDYPGESLYGSAVLLRFRHRLRDEMSFPNLDALKMQIAEDVKVVSTTV